MLQFTHSIQKQSSSQRMRIVAFCMAFAMVMTINVMPQLYAQAAAYITDSTAVLASTAITSDRIVVFGAEDASADTVLEQGIKVTVRHGETEEFATTRRNETVSALLTRLKLGMTPLEMAFVDLSGEQITVEVASDYTFYETAQEAAAYTTLYTPGYEIPKGENKVTQSGINGTRDVVYEVVYADGELLSRQAVSESNNTSVTELVRYGTLVKDAQAGDTISAVIKNADGSGYLKMKSGDSLHFSGSMKVTCTAYTAGVGKVGTVTATGTKVHRGTLAVDKRVIPLGTKMFVVGSTGYTYGQGLAEDTGVRGAWVDLYMNSLEECRQFGRQNNSTVYFLD